MTSYGGAFTWPASGLVEAPDWNPIPECGGGLHGFLNGCGNGALADWNESAKWLVVAVDSEAIVDLKGKVKFPKGEVVFCGAREEAIAKLEELAPETKHMPVIGAIRIAGDRGNANAGDYGTAIAGHKSTATAGYRGKTMAGDNGTATAGNYGKATAGDGGTANAGDGGKAMAGDGGTANAGDGGKATAGYGGAANAGDYGKATAGNNGTATAGYNGTAIAGNHGKAMAGNQGTAIAGDWGTATAGDEGSAIAGWQGTATAGERGTANAGHKGTAMAGAGGRISISWDERKTERIRTTTGYIGEDNIQANIPYKCDEEGKLIPAGSSDTPLE